MTPTRCLVGTLTPRNPERAAGRTGLRAEVRLPRS